MGICLTAAESHYFILFFEMNQLNEKKSTLLYAQRIIIFISKTSLEKAGTLPPLCTMSNMTPSKPAGLELQLLNNNIPRYLQYNIIYIYNITVYILRGSSVICNWQFYSKKYVQCTWCKSSGIWCRSNRMYHSGYWIVQSKQELFTEISLQLFRGMG